MRKCSVFGCYNRAEDRRGKLSVRPLEENQGQKKIHFHRFPSDLNIKLLWIKELRLVDWQPTKSSYVCSVHFLRSDYLYHESCVPRLNPNAVPSVFKSYPAYLQKKVKTRKPPKERHDPPVSKRIKRFQIADISIANIANDENPIADDRTFSAMISEPNTSSNNVIICETSSSSNNAMICESSTNSNNGAMIGESITRSNKRKMVEKSTSTFAAPRKASRSISPTKALLRNECLKYKRLIKKLHQQKRLQEKKIASLKNVISKLKQEFSSESCCP